MDILNQGILILTFLGGLIGVIFAASKFFGGKIKVVLEQIKRDINANSKEIDLLKSQCTELEKCTIRLSGLFKQISDDQNRISNEIEGIKKDIVEIITDNNASIVRIVDEIKGEIKNLKP